MSRRVAILPACALALALSAGTPGSGAASAACATGPPMAFGPAGYVDRTRAGGEPTVTAHPNGTLLYSAHAGTTHFYSPAAADTTTSAFFENYEGQVYSWYSTDNGENWTFSPRRIPDNFPLSGFSDPDFAIDTAGNVYLSEINLINVAMSKSSDTGKTWRLQNFFAQTMTDRQWSEADEKDVVYLVGNAFAGGTSTNPAGNIGHFLYKSKDGGQTFTPGQADEPGLGDIRVDQSDGTLYETRYDPETGNFAMGAFRRARKDDLTPEVHTIAAGVGMRSHWPAFDLDSEGNLYVVWDETGDGEAHRASGIWYAYSTTRGRTWSAPVRIDAGDKTDIWPWIAAGDAGRVAVAWFEATKHVPGDDAEAAGDHGWRLMAAQSLNGLGCDASQVPGFRITAATPPIHFGTVCMGGTVCQAQAIDRRLGDYFTIDVDGAGRLVAAYSDTREGGSVALPGFVRQIGGPSFHASSPGLAKPKTPRTNVLGRRQGGRLASTGLDPWDAGAQGVLLLASAAALRRRLRGAR